MSKISETIFKKFDIRGKYPEEVNEEVFYRIGRAIAEIWQPTDKIKKVVIGRDARASSESLFQALAKGLNRGGIKVLDIGLCSSPMLYFAVCDLQESLGVMITASHLGKDFNGLKIVKKKAVPLTQQEMEKIYQKALSAEEDNIGKKIDIEKMSVKASYLKKIMSFKKSQLKKMKVVIDCGGGMAVLFVKEIFGNLENIEPIYLFENLDGSFSGRGSNPLEAKNREEIKETILDNKADLGIMFDGDADRVVFFYSKGEKINYNFISALMIKFLAKEGAVFVADVRSSKLIADIAESLNVKLVISAAGHTEIKKTMRSENALFGEESSGHYFFQDFWGLDDAMIAALVFLQAISENPSQPPLIKGRSRTENPSQPPLIKGRSRTENPSQPPLIKGRSKTENPSQPPLIKGRSKTEAKRSRTEIPLLAKEGLGEVVLQKLQFFKSKYHILEETNFEINSKNSGEALKKIEEKYKKKAVEILKIDGLSMNFGSWRFNLRSSQTEPLLRLNMEADTKELLQEKFKEISLIIKKR